MQISAGFIEPSGDLQYWGRKGNTDWGWSIYTVFSGFQQLTSQLFHFCLLAPLPSYDCSLPWLPPSRMLSSSTHVGAGYVFADYRHQLRRLSARDPAEC